jgi:hypothetical protein
MTTTPPLGPRHTAFIPLRKNELIDLLCTDPAVAPEQRDGFRTFCHDLVRCFHQQYSSHGDRLKDTYAPFNPDADTQTLQALTPEQRQQRLDQFFDEIGWMMERANFVRLGPKELDEALASASAWGINMEVDLNVFERFAIFARGDIMGKRLRRRWRLGARPVEQEVPIYQRLVLVMKLRPHRRLGPDADTESIHIKVFKDIPKMDLEMLLPGARPRFTRIDQGMITFPLATGMLITMWTFLKPLLVPLLAGYLSRELAEVLGAGEAGQRGAGYAGAWFGLAVVAFAYTYRSYFNYVHRKTSYSLRLTESLYYQNLVNNAGGLTWLVDEVEEQECREALLAYFVLWRHAGPTGSTPAELDRGIEEYLRQQAGVDTDFEVADALAKVERLGVVEKVGDRYRARPLEEALARLRAC